MFEYLVCDYDGYNQLYDSTIECPVCRRILRRIVLPYPIEDEEF